MCHSQSTFLLLRLYSRYTSRYSVARIWFFFTNCPVFLLSWNYIFIQFSVANLDLLPFLPALWLKLNFSRFFVYTSVSLSNSNFFCNNSRMELMVKMARRKKTSKEKVYILPLSQSQVWFIISNSKKYPLD